MDTKVSYKVIVLLLILVAAASPVLSRADAARHQRARSHAARSALRKNGAKPAAKYVKDLSIARIVDSWLARPELSRSLVGVEVMDAKTGDVLFSHNGTKRFTPASTAKVFTTACAYDLLGPDFRYRTSLTTSGDIVGNRLKGDLILNPSQDPTLGRGDLLRLFNELTGQGVRIVDGVFHVSRPDGGGDQFMPGWLNEDWGQDWMPVSSDLVLDHNVFTGGALPKNAKLIELPAESELSSQTRSLLRQDLSPGWLIYDPKANIIRALRGYPSLSAKGPLIVGNPTVFNGSLAAAMAQESGIHFGKQSKEDPAKSGARRVLAQHLSQPITKIIEVTLHESDNLFAQQLLRTIGALEADDAKRRKSPFDPDILEERGVVRLERWLASIGGNTQEVILKDGCGLSRKNCVSPHALNTVLRHMAAKYGDRAYVSLLKGGQVRSTGAGTYRFKTGAMDSVRTITGILKNTSGRNLLVTIMVNGHTPRVGDVRTSMGALISQLVGAPVLEEEEKKPALPDQSR
ncbi:MAG TPA: D-alanyl-D-alanine carboxypeptidase/D-alanyl-D-alanine-endopeptidase [Candidatus Obscuribacterales bacterium]